MQILDRTGGNEWLIANNGNDFNHLVNSVPEASDSYAIKADSGAKTALAREISAVIALPCMLWVHEIGIWPSAQNLPLVELMRRAAGEQRPIDHAPVHIFDVGDNQLLFAYLSAVLYF